MMCSWKFLGRWQKNPAIQADDQAVGVEPTGNVNKTTRTRGMLAEDQALAYLRRAGLKLVTRNYRTPGRGGGEIDLIMRDRDGTLVFVEVRSRGRSDFGGAGGSIGQNKQNRIILAARHYLAACNAPPPCRFDVVLLEPDVRWLKSAFEAGE